LFELSFVKGCVHLSSEEFSKMICELKISACIPPLCNMCPPPIYPQLPYLYDHGLAVLACITPFWNMRPPSISTLNQSTPFHLKRSCWRSDFSPLISSKPPSSQETGHRKKERKWGRKSIEKRKKERKLQESLQIKGKSIFWEEKNTSTSKILFYMIPFSTPIILKTFSKSLRNFLNSFWPSFSLVIYMTWVVPFSFTHELHIFSL
jgi:hypothetical protein